MKIAFLGDSITEGCGATMVDNFYINHVGKILGAEVLNYGVGGTRLAKQKEISEVEQWDYDFFIPCGNYGKGRRSSSYIRRY